MCLLLFVYIDGKIHYLFITFMGLREIMFLGILSKQIRVLDELGFSIGSKYDTTNAITLY